MLEWLKRHGRNARGNETGDTVNRQARDISGRYLAFHKYLENRYANTVVLTFAQIEDLLGFALPSLARTDKSWWTVGEASAAEPSFSAAWTLAGRTAKPNLLARTVVFERAS